VKTKEVVCPRCNGERSESVWDKSGRHVENKMCELCEGRGVWVIPRGT
jgi:transcription elongation factor Elf1